MIKLTDKFKEESTLEINKNTSDTINKKIRTSLTAYLKKGMTSEVKKIEERSADFANVSYDRIEALQTVVYSNNEYYKEHLDTFPPTSKYMQNGGNRIGSIFCFLNTLEKQDGGCIHFINLKIRIKPEKGNAVYFENMKDGLPDQRLLHEGESILTDTLKYGLNIWIREREYVD
jgi:prolyl 4-hydroxylase